MNTEIMRLLLLADDPLHAESPPDFHWHQEMEFVRQLQPEIEKIVGQVFDMDSQVQDASFFTALNSCTAGDQMEKRDVRLSIRFSAFGRLFTIRNWGKAELPLSALREVVTVVETAGFRYIDSDSLEENYSGVNPLFAGLTWYDRFFNYV